MMQGISTLPGAQQNPGQAAPLQALPPQQPKTPAETINTLNSQLSEDPEIRLQQARALYAQNPTLTTLGLVSKAFKAYNLAQKEKNQEALAAYQQQGPQTVADQLFQQTGAVAQPLSQHTQYARHGGVMHGYAGGGTVALQSGGDPEVERILKKAPMARTPEENAILRAAGVQLTQRTIPAESTVSSIDKFLGSLFGPKAESTADVDAYKDPSRKLDVAPSPAVVETNLTSVNSIPAIEAALRDPSTPKNERDALEAALVKLHEKRAANAGITDLSTSSAGSSAPSARPTGGGVATLGVSPTLAPGITEEAARQAAELEKRKALPPELAEARKGLTAREASNIEAQRAATGAYGKESEAAMEAARKAREAPRPDDIQYLGQMLEGTRGAKRFGEALAGAGAGAGRAEANRAALLREAEKIRREDQRLIRAEEAATRQMQILSAQRVLAERQGDFDRVNQIDDKIASIKMGLEQAKQGQAEKAAKFGLDVHEAESKRIAAQAAMAGAVARQGAHAATTLTPDQRAKYWEKATDNVNTDKRFGVLANEAKKAAAKTGTPFDEVQFRNQLIAAQYERMVAAAEGRPVVTPPPPTAGRVIDFNAIK